MSKPEMRAFVRMILTEVFGQRTTPAETEAVAKRITAVMPTRRFPDFNSEQAARQTENAWQEYSNKESE